MKATGWAIEVFGFNNGDEPWCPQTGEELRDYCERCGFELDEPVPFDIGDALSYQPIDPIKDNGDSIWVCIDPMKHRGGLRSHEVETDGNGITWALVASNFA